MNVVRRQIEEEEGKARTALVDLLTLIGQVPEERISEVAKHLDKALDEAKKAVEDVKRGTTKVRSR